ncbi:MAG: hypothetical protein HC815_31335 [Richelia sp. RM1_1_1]|nr:hypothetical protein [Richelia sp. RM1_1_1]
MHRLQSLITALITALLYWLKKINFCVIPTTPGLLIGTRPRIAIALLPYIFHILPQKQNLHRCNSNHKNDVLDNKVE